MTRVAALCLLLPFLILPAAADINADLLAAAERRDAARVGELLRSGAAVDTADSSGRTPLMLAARAGSADVVKLLLSSRASVDSADTAGWTALMYGAVYGSRTIVEDLLSAGADPRLRESLGKTAEELAAQKAHQAVVTVLRQRREAEDSRAVERLNQRFDSVPAAELERLISEGTPELRRKILEAAFAQERTDIVRRLLGLGDRPDLDSPRPIGLAVIPPVAWYALKGDAATLAALLASGASAQAVYRGGTLSNPDGAVEQAGGDRRFKSAEERDFSAAHRGKSALVLAVGAGHAAAVELLAAKGAPVPADSLALAIRSRQVDMAGLLVEKGAPLDGRAVAVAVDCDNTEFIERVAAGRVPADQAPEALAQAIAGGHLAAARALLRGRLTNRSGRTAAFSRAIGAGYLSLADLIRKEGIDASILDAALLDAASQANTEAVRYLLANGASASARGTDRAGKAGVTALMLAARLLDVETAGVLIEAGADVRATDADGRDAAWYLEQGKRDGVTQRDVLKIRNRLQAALDR